jgi:DNA-binding CsgD family transcriptional regulator
MPAKRWTTERLFRLTGLVEAGASDADMAKALGVSVNAVKIARHRNGLPSRTESSLTALSVARLLGTSHEAVSWWLREGWLKGRRNLRRGPNRQWWVDEADLWRFCEEARYWPLWDPARIPDRAFQEWAIEMRRERAAERWLTPEEVAPRFFVEPKTLRRWLGEGRLPAIKLSRFWFVDPAAVADGSR